MALLVLLTFVVGSIVAPASHYAFMLYSDVYGVGHHQHNTHQDGHDAGHEAHASTASHNATPVQASDAGVEHFYCEYAALFATFAATGPVAAPVVDGTPHTGLISATADLHPDFSLPAAFQQRGPPVL